MNDVTFTCSILFPNIHKFEPNIHKFELVASCLWMPSALLYRGTTDSFVGIDTGDLTKGVFNGASLFEGNNLSCFFLQATQAGLADPLSPLLEPVGEIMDYLNKNLAPQIQGLNCPQLTSYNNYLFSKYPGAKYTGN